MPILDNYYHMATNEEWLKNISTEDLMDNIANCEQLKKCQVCRYAIKELKKRVIELNGGD